MKQKDLGNLNNWTKNDLSRVIVQALMNLDAPAKPDNFQVKLEMKKKKIVLVNLATQAIEVINQKLIARL